MLQDLQSTNGTFLDGARVSPDTPVKVRAGVPIKVGATTFELRK
jgi:pSer/pThr/pTyr-binding forkhead associated (FHA) protein